MVFSVRVSAVIALAAAATSVLGAPWPESAKFHTHRVRDLPHGVQVRAYQPESVYETFGAGIDHPLSRRSVPASAQEAALSFVESRTGVNSTGLVYRTGFAGEESEHVYIHQQFNGIKVGNAVANVAIKNDKIVAYGASFIEPASVSAPTPSISATDAIAKAEAHLNAKYNSWPTTVEYYALDTDHVVLAHTVQVQNDDHWFLAHVDAHTGEVVNVIDYVAHATYLVNPISHQSPLEGFQTLTDPFDKTASPNGWHLTGGTTYTTTRGNNVIAYKSSTSGTTAQSSATDNFNYVWDSTQAPTATVNLNAARVNGFYIGNTIHDLTYRYGFTEAAYNFQADNGSKGGKGSDAVNLSIQDSSGTNNANFATPADGQAPTCRMFTWTYTTPNRDGAFENDIPVHEFTHGTTNRLTGGGTGACLQTTEAGGMGEGWSDVFAFVTEQTSATVKDFTMGSYVVNSAAGIRSHPYSTSKTVNPYTYATVKTQNEVHAIGEVWANTLINVYAALVAKYGFASNLFDPTQTQGNVVFLHLYMDALSLQPCNPTFLTARNAIIQADANRYGGVNKCLLWNAFASRGLGSNAAGYVDSSTVPSGC